VLEIMAQDVLRERGVPHPGGLQTLRSNSSQLKNECLAVPTILRTAKALTSASKPYRQGQRNLSNLSLCKSTENSEELAHRGPEGPETPPAAGNVDGGSERLAQIDVELHGLKILAARLIKVAN
jgi:hypothetical protein